MNSVALCINDTVKGAHSTTGPIEVFQPFNASNTCKYMHEYSNVPVTCTTFLLKPF